MGAGCIDARPGGIAWAVGVANQRLMRQLAEAPNVFVLDAERWIALGGPQAYNDRSYYLGKIPFSETVFRPPPRRSRRQSPPSAARPRKVVVVDLDNTLWGGVVGDVGLGGDPTRRSRRRR